MDVLIFSELLPNLLPTSRAERIFKVMDTNKNLLLTLFYYENNQRIRRTLTGFQKLADAVAVRILVVSLQKFIVMK